MKVLGLGLWPKLVWAHFSFHYPAKRRNPSEFHSASLIRQSLQSSEFLSILTCQIFLYLFVIRYKWLNIATILLFTFLTPQISLFCSKMPLGLIMGIGRAMRRKRTSSLDILSSKRAPRDYYKGKNCKPTGFHTRKGPIFFKVFI